MNKTCKLAPTVSCFKSSLHSSENQRRREMERINSTAACCLNRQPAVGPSPLYSCVLVDLWSGNCHFGFPMCCYGDHLPRPHLCGPFRAFFSFYKNKWRLWSYIRYQTLCNVCVCLCLCAGTRTRVYVCAYMCYILLQPPLQSGCRIC